jgi:hypothetical protein
MTCSEFKAIADSLALREVARGQNGALAEHARECPNCEALLRERRMLSGALQALALRTAGREASPDLERTLLKVLRLPACERGLSVEAQRFRPIVTPMSRRFSLGAYATVAAALALALFLGYRAIDRPVPVADSPLPGLGQAPEKSANERDHREKGIVARAIQATVQTTSIGATALPATKAAAVRHMAVLSLSQPVPSDEALARAGYVGLMLCDPLSCAAETQVVRMEIPVQGAEEQGGQSVIADVVLGDDGSVRAVRIVN